MAVFSQDSLKMRSFLYREPRIKTNLSMDFIFGDTVVLGVCRSLSESGAGGTLAHPVPVGSEGVLTLYFDQHSVKVPTIIEAPDAEEARMRFLTHDPANLKEREALRLFLKLLTQSPQA